ncbi:MAG: photosynthetic complex assembly protein PuhC [Pseudomonadota bacterium]
MSTAPLTRPNQPRDKELVPRILLRAIALFVLVVLALVTWARIAGVPPTAQPDDSQIIHERVIHIFGEMTGAARVLDANGAVITELGATQGGFIAGVARSLTLKRRQAGVDPAAPVRLVQFKDGHLGLRDDYTGWRAELIGFGKDNAAAFAKLLDK